MSYFLILSALVIPLALLRRHDFLIVWSKSKILIPTICLRTFYLVYDIPRLWNLFLYAFLYFAMYIQDNSFTFSTSKNMICMPLLSAQLVYVSTDFWKRRDPAY